MTVAVAWTTVPWHCLLFLACFCGGVDGSSVDDGVRQRWGGSRTWCLGTIVAAPYPRLHIGYDGGRVNTYMAAEQKTVP